MRRLDPNDRDTRVLWREGAVRLFFGRCDDCDRVVDDDGKPLLVARQSRSGKFQCLVCFAASPTGSLARRTLIRRRA